MKKFYTVTYKDENGNYHERNFNSQDYLIDTLREYKLLANFRIFSKWGHHIITVEDFNVTYIDTSITSYNLVARLVDALHDADRLVINTIK